MKMIDHISSYTTDFPAARSFYEAALGSLGYAIQVEMVTDWDAEFPERRCCAWGPSGKTTFWVIETREAASPRHIAFSAPNRAAVDGFHKAAIGAGGRDHGEPGVRAVYHADYYGAFVLDPDDNNVEAVCHTPG
jgi:catechol 2,3-dioxygenase-like lactoylglutathione lyase family enzyme